MNKSNVKRDGDHIEKKRQEDKGGPIDKLASIQTRNNPVRPIANEPAVSPSVRFALSYSAPPFQTQMGYMFLL